MALDLTAIDAVLKDFYGPVIISLLNNKVKLLDLFTKNGDKSLAADGRNVKYPIQYGRNVGVGSVGESKTLPAAGNQQTTSVTIPYRYTYGRIQLTKQTIEASKTSKGAFKKAMELETKGLVNDLRRERNRQMWGFGVGMLCRVSGTQGAGTSILMKDRHGVAGATGAATLLQAGDVVAVVRNATPSSATDSDIQVVRAVSSISADGNTVTFSATTGTTLNDNDFLVRAPAGTSVTDESSLNKEPMGLLGLVDDGTYVSTLHGVSRTTYPNFKSPVISLNGNFSFDLMQRAEDLTDEKGDGEVDVILSHHSVRREYLKLLFQMKRFTNEGGMKPDAGYSGAAVKEDVEWSNKPWKAERMAPYGMIFGINKSSMVRYVNCEGEWADDDGTILLRTLNKDIYEGRYRVFENFALDDPQSCFRIDGVAATVDVTLVE